MTEELFRNDGYLRDCTATVTKLIDGGVCVDRTVFYPTGGGQPGDTGVLIRADGSRVDVVDCYKDRDSGLHVHRLAEGAPGPDEGEMVTLEIDWPRRHALMRMHSTMHMLCAVVPFPVTGGSISEDRGRLDFDAPEPLDKDEITAKLNALVEGAHPMSITWITDEEMAAQPDLVRTMSVKPPSGAGKVRLVRFEGVDLQPCGGTHVANTSEIGRVRVRKIEKKGRQNRRIIVEFDDR